MKPLSNTSQPKFTPGELTAHWAVCTCFILLLLSYNIICYLWTDEIRLQIEEPQRILFRSVLYAIAIVLFPLTKLLRHILLRLNQTMPGDETAGRRYLTTVIVTLSLIETVGLFGVLMFILGDDFNTLTIFSLLAALGIFLYRPKFGEYLSIQDALTHKNN